MRDRGHPSGWSLAQLSSTALPGRDGFTDGDWIESPYITDSGIRLIQTGNIGVGEFLDKLTTKKFISKHSFRLLGCKWVRPGDLLICRMADPIGRACMVPNYVGDSITAVDCTIYRPSPDMANASYMLHRLNSAEQLRKAADIAGGSTRQRISRNNLGAMVVPLPPLPEQRRIAEILDTLDEAIRKTEKVIAKLQQMKQGLLHDLLTRGIDENGELRDPERHPEQFKDSLLGRIPREWEVRRLADAAEIRSGIAKNSNKAVGNPIWVHYLRVANVQDGFLDLSEVSRIQIAPEDIERYAVQDGDVLMNEGGDLDKLGRGGIWRGELAPCIHQNHVFAVRCGADLLPELLDAWTGSPAARRYFMTAGKQTTNLASINKTALGQLPVIIPPPSEQQFIIEPLRHYDERIELERFAQVKLRHLKQGLMDDLMTGRVRVIMKEEVRAA